MTGGNKMKRGKDLEAEGRKGESGLMDRQVESLCYGGHSGRSRRLRAGPEPLQAPAARKFLLLPRLCQHTQPQWGAAFSLPYRPGTPAVCRRKHPQGLGTRHSCDLG